MADKKYLFIFALLAIAGLASAMFEIQIIDQTPQNPVPKTQQVSIRMIVTCQQGMPCENPPPDFRFTLSAYTGTDGEAIVDPITLGQITEIKFRCNSYRSCRELNQPLMLEAKMIDERGFVLQPTKIVPTQTIFIDAQNEPPIAMWAEPPPALDKKTVTINLRYIDPDNDPGTLENVIFADENGQKVDYPNSGWNSKTFKVQGIALEQTLEYTCQLAVCEFPLTIQVQAKDPSGALSPPISYQFEPGVNQPPKISISPQSEYDLISKKVSIAFSIEDEKILGVIHKMKLTVLPNMNPEYTQGFSLISENEDEQNGIGLYNYEFICSDCPQEGFLLEIKATDKEELETTATKELLPNALESILAPAYITFEPLRPYEGQNFKVIVNQKENSEKIDFHIYSFYKITQNEKIPIRENIEVRVDSAGLKSVFEYKCSNDCEGVIGVDVRAKRGSDISQIKYNAIMFGIEPANKPVLISVEPQSKFQKLKNDGGELIEPVQTISFVIGAAPNGPPADKFVVSTKRGREIVQSLSFEQNSNLGDLRFGVDCQSLGCKKKEFFSIEVVPYVKNQPGEPLKLGLIVYDPNTEQPPGIGQVCDTGINESINYMGAGLIAMILIIALIYMGGEALNNPQLIEWSKNEALQLVFVPVIFIIIILLAGTVCDLPMETFFTWAPTLEGYHIGPDMSIMGAAQETLYWGIGQTHLTVAMIRTDLGVLNMRATRNRYDNQGLGFGMNGFSHSDFSGDYTSIGTLTMLLNLNSTFLITLVFQYFSLVFFSAAKGFFFALVPIGLIVRAIPYLRSFGGGMVALGVGLFIFYPIVIALSGLILAPVYAEMDASDAYSVYYGDGTGMSLPQMLVEVERVEAGITGDSVTSYVNDYPQPKVAMSGQKEYDTNVAGGEEMRLVNFPQFFTLTAQNFIRSVFIPTAALLVTVAFIANLAIVFGGEIDASRLVQMI